jgi:hypothetical protein
MTYNPQVASGNLNARARLSDARDQPIPQINVVLEQLAAAQLLKQLPQYYGNGGLTVLLINIPTLCQMNPVQTFHSGFIINFNIVFQSTSKAC